MQAWVPSIWVASVAGVGQAGTAVCRYCRFPEVTARGGWVPAAAVGSRRRRGGLAKRSSVSVPPAGVVDSGA